MVIHLSQASRVKHRVKNVSAGCTDNIQGKLEVEVESEISPSCGQEKNLSTEGSLTLLEPEATDQMELCLDPEDPILVQSQTSDMMVEEATKQVLGMETQEKVHMAVQNQPMQGPKPPIQAERRSSREVGSGTPMMEKAVKLKAQKNLQGTSNKPFTILQNVDNKQLAKVVVACNIV